MLHYSLSYDAVLSHDTKVLDFRFELMKTVVQDFHLQQPE